MASFWTASTKASIESRSQLVLSQGATHVVFNWPISKLGGKDLEKFTTSPTLLAVRVVGEMIRMDFSEAVFKVVRSRPRIAWSCDHSWRRDGFLWSRLCVCNSCERHAGRSQGGLPSKEGEELRRTSQLGKSKRSTTKHKMKSGPPQEVLITSCSRFHGSRPSSREAKGGRCPR